MPLRLLACLCAAALLAATAARADVAGDMESFFGDLNFTNVTKPGAYEGQSAGYYTGGSLFMRVPQRNYTLYSIQFPKFRAGCGGIDLFSGGFSFINADQFVAMLQNIGSVAVSQAFMLALRTISPQIASTMEQIETWAQKYGLNSVNACEAGSELLGGVLKQFGADKQGCIVERVGSRGEAWAEAEVACTTGGERRATLDGAAPGSAADVIATPGNIAWRALYHNSFFRSDKNMAQVMMNLSGTIILAPQEPGKEDTLTIRRIYPSILEDSRGQQFLQALLVGGEVTIRTCSDGTSDERSCTEMDTETTLKIDPAKSFTAMVGTLLNGIAGKIGADAALDDAQRGLLSATTLPVHKFLTVEYAMLPGLISDSIDQYAALIAKDILYTYLRDLLGKVSASVSTLPNQSGDKVEAFNDGVRKAREQISAFMEKNRKAFDESLMFTTRVREYERALIGRLSPGIYRNLVWASSQ
ncbi:MAG: conjugal transfer protein TraH [Gammaproteobacteria bacterium]|uniref:Conjugative transfer pilus assembly protein TraH n=1 Tax=Thioalbus denitrificans TaxID=547122 RepID=A0A369C202_9GAMM|nr:conjugal transfer protein TraH [Thioalbus denitrificans]MDD3448077.1 conjugal transfer protein TraH [Gammaproteobacteria bacterium]RCX27990.1 conjugative transfer pilus assembly protein TraH [Thioalbus denitrificans]